MERYMREHADEHVALGFLTRKDHRRSPLERVNSVTVFDHQGESAGEDSSPSCASSSAGNTPSYNSETCGLAFEFGQKCTLQDDPGMVVPQSCSSDQLATEQLDSEPDSPTREWPCAIVRKAMARKGSVDNAKSSDGQNGTSGDKSKKLSRLLRRTHSAGCSKDVPSHALFMREKTPVTKTKSAETPISCGREDADDRQAKRNRKTLAQDMKFRLSFLRRRHTDSSLQPSVRPSPEEAQKWAESFEELTASKYGLSLFRAFLSREFSEENIEFWLACEDFKKTRTNKMVAKARKIYNDFIAVQAPKEVNLDPTTRTNIMSNLSNPDRHSFDLAQRRIQGHMEQDAYLRFLQCELYMELLHRNNPR